jgi:competence protein ComEA
VIGVLVACALVGAVVSDDDDAKADHAEAVVVVDLNHASLSELCTLPGIGPKKAEAILLQRSRRPFTRLTQLLQVKGIGPKILDRLKDHVTLGPPKPAPRPPSKPRAPAPTSPTSTTLTTSLLPLPPLAPLAPSP